jgi:phosphosulfolactate phosphohydrolase-like enzyme
LLQAGRNNQDAPEDALAAGAIFHAMRGVRLRAPAPPTSTAIESEFFASPAGQNLHALGYAEDVRYCARLDEHTVVPALTDGLLVPLPESR